MSIAGHCNWRDCQEWNKLGLPMSTTSNEACKLYDATLTQYVAWYDDESLGGLEGTATKLVEADPNFVMGHVLNLGLDLMGTGRTATLDPEFKKALDNLAQLAEKSQISERETLHAKAIGLCGQGYMKEATDVWEDILIKNPLDMLALKYAHDCYFYLGFQPQMRDSIARVIPHWKRETPLYRYLILEGLQSKKSFGQVKTGCHPYLMGMHSFGLCETNLFPEAEKVSRWGLELNPRDGWSTHSLAHVLEMQGRFEEGISFLSGTVKDWSACGMIACHDFWHWAVYHIEKGEYQGAVDLYDAEIGVRSNKSGAMLDIVDACSMLFRLEMEGVNVGDRWHDIFETCRPHIDDHIMAFNDAHILMSCLGDNQKETTQKMMDSIKEYVQNGVGTNQDITKDVGATICESLAAYKDCEYAKAVDILYPKRYKIARIGGSNAQRDLFNLYLIQACLRSPEKEHHKLARHLLVERKYNKDCAPMTDRLRAKAMALHID